MKNYAYHGIFADPDKAIAAVEAVKGCQLSPEAREFVYSIAAVLADCYEQGFEAGKAVVA